MPNFALHALFASWLAESWRAEPGLAPFDLLDARARNAFLHGAVGPDMGMYPGGERILSDLVHRVRSGRIARALVARATNDVERAFAWGWVTHVIADTVVHPLVNRAAAQSLGRTDVLLEDGRQQAAHIRLEIGLDSVYLGRHGFLRDIRLGLAFDERSIAFLDDVLAEVYGIRFQGDALLRSHRAVVRTHRHLLFLARLVAHRWRRGRPAFALAAVSPLVGVARRVAAFGMGGHSPAAALLDPVRPDRSLLLAVDGAIRRFPGIVRRCQEEGLTTLPDFDLETGDVEDPLRPTTAALATLRALADRGLTVRGHPAATHVA